MTTTGSLILFVSIGILLITGLSALGDFRANVNDTNGSIQSNADLGVSASSSLFTIFGYISLAVAAIALLTVFRNL